MTIINFLEIPKANTGSGNQDTFELFARDFFEDLGYRIIQGPGRGSDSGRDLIIEERRVGVGGETFVRWLVSCKHYAHSGKSVGVEDETNILDRLNAAKAGGFLTFYSTLPSAGLVTRLQELTPTCEHCVYDCAKIETHLLRLESGHRLFSRYFPISHRNWSVAHPRKAQLHLEEEPLACAYCKRDLLAEDRAGMGMLVLWEDTTTRQIDTVYWCCKGHCDSALGKRYSAPSHTDIWDELGDYTLPTIYILSVTHYLTSINEGRRFSEDALANLRKFMILTFHHVSRDLTPNEKEIVRTHILCGLP